MIPSFVFRRSSFVKELSLSILAALLLIIPFFYPNLWIFAWFGFVPLFSAIEGKSKRKAFLLAYFTGVIFWLGAIYWLTNVTAAGYVLLSLYLALYFGIFGLFYASSFKLQASSQKACGLRPVVRSQILHSAIFFPSLWVCLEYLRGHLLTGFPWALLGYSQYLNLPAIQIADICGAYGVSFLVVMGNVVIYKVISHRPQATGHRQKIKKLLFFACSLLFVACSYGYYKIYALSRIPYPLSLKVSVIQANIPQELKWDRGFNKDISDKYFRLTRKAAKDDPDLIIWPETAVQDYLIIGKNGYFNMEKTADFIKEINLPLLLGAVAVGGENFYNSAVLFSPKGEILTRYDKLHLVPFGEYIPLRTALPFLEAVVPIGDFTPGKEYVVFQIPTKFSTLVCFEDVFPNLARNFVKNGAQFLVNITNDAWFGDTSEPYQHLAASVLRAVENRRPVVRAANTGVSCFISPYGEIAAKVSNAKGKGTFIDGYITGEVILTPDQALYTRYGDIFVLLCFVIAGCGIIIKLKRTSAPVARAPV